MAHEDRASTNQDSCPFKVGALKEIHWCWSLSKALKKDGLPMHNILLWKKMKLIEACVSKHSRYLRTWFDVDASVRDLVPLLDRFGVLWTPTRWLIWLWILPWQRTELLVEIVPIKNHSSLHLIQCLKRGWIRENLVSPLLDRSFSLNTYPMAVFKQLEL